MPNSKVAKVALIGIGDIIWYRNTEWEGSQFNKLRITGSTSRSWILQTPDVDPRMYGDPRYGVKLPKSLKNFEIGTEEQAKKKMWASSHLWDIRRRLDYFHDTEATIAIARILKMEVPDFGGKQESNEQPETGQRQNP